MGFLYPHRAPRAHRAHHARHAPTTHHTKGWYTMNRIRNLVATMFNTKKKDRNKECLFSYLHFCTEHTGKMSGMYSLSTNPYDNENCRQRAQIPGSICEKCFSMAMQNRFTGLAKWTHSNTEILTGSVIDYDKLPYINAHSFRFEAFGDLKNSTQVKNYFNICKKNPSVMFAIWTKNPFIIKNAINEGYAKPENLIVIYSSPMINVKVSIDDVQRAFPFVDKVFTVYDSAETATAHGVTINCGEKNCIECLICYRHNNITQVSELLK